MVFVAIAFATPGIEVFLDPPPPPPGPLVCFDCVVDEPDPCHPHRFPHGEHGDITVRVRFGAVLPKRAILSCEAPGGRIRERRKIPRSGAVSFTWLPRGARCTLELRGGVKQKVTLLAEV